VRNLLTTFAFLLPFKRLKVRLLNLLGHAIHPTAHVGISLVRGVKRFELAEGSGIGNFNVIGGLDLVTLGRGARINYFNLIMAGVTLEGEEVVRGVHRTLRMGPESRIISFHILDCSGGLIVGEDCWITGMRTTVLTHAFDPHEGGIIVEPVELKKGSLVATSCTLLPGAVVGEGALLAAGSTLWTRQELAAGSLHGGVPARRLAPITINDWVYTFQRYRG
jgi:acetyltransferase-like isoleucine patch superfamily enzyme